MTPAETTIGLVAVVGVVALAMKLFSRDERPVTPTREVDPVDALLAEVSGADAHAAGDVVAVTSDGWSFVPDGEDVTLIPPENPELGDMAPASEGRTQAMVLPPSHIDVGDFIGARVIRGAPGHDPWRLEALGRDGEYRAWFFETEGAARAALDLLERRIVRVPVDDDGDPRPSSGADFDEARRIDEETERALDADEE